jgi:hypothetical protein
MYGPCVLYVYPTKFVKTGNWEKGFLEGPKGGLWHDSVRVNMGI